MTVVTAGATRSCDVADLGARDVTAAPRPPRSRIHAAVCRMLGDIGNLEGAVLQERNNNKRTTNHDAENHSCRVFSNANQSKRPSSVRGGQSASRSHHAAKTTSECRVLRRHQWAEYLEQNTEGDTRLHVAVVQQLTILVASLVRAAPHPSCLDIGNDDAQTPLHVAVLTRQPDVARWLMEAGADAASRDRRGNTALHLACRMGDMSCVRALTKRRGDRQLGGTCRQGRDAETLVAMPCEQMEDVSYFKALAKDVQPLVNTTKALAQPCQMEGFKALTQCRESQDANAVSKHSPRRDINVPINSGQLEDVACVNALTHHSLVGENTKVITSSCHEGVKIRSQKTEYLKVPNDLSKEVVRCTEGLEKNEKRGDRGEPVADEISPRELSVLNYEGETCAHVATNHGHVEVLRWLVQCGADPDARDAKSGNTVLHVAVERGIDGVSRYLLEECDLDLGTTNYAGLTAYDVARDVSPVLAGEMARRGARRGGRGEKTSRRGATKKGES